MPKEILGRKKPDVKKYDLPAEGRYSPGVIRHDFNERTTPPSKKVLEALRQAIGNRDGLQVYPDYSFVNEIIADYAGVKPDQVLATNGSDDAITTICRKTLQNGDMVILPKPTFSTLEDEPRRQRAEIISPIYKEDENFAFPFQETMDAITGDIRLVVICNPNNPTGTSIERGKLIEVIEKADEVGADVLVDEAYHEFAPGLTVADMVSNYANLYITRTLSKAMGIAGLRPGYIISQASNIHTTDADDPKLDTFQNPYAVNQLAVVAMKALKEPEVRRDIADYVSEVMGTSKPMLEEFYRQNNIDFFSSKVNFHLLRMPKDFVEFLQAKGIFIRIKKDLPGMVRVSIGTREDTRKYLEALQEYLNLSK